MSSRQPSRLVAIVDDDESVLRSLQDLIESDGLSPLGFGSAEQFLESEARNEVALLVSSMYSRKPHLLRFGLDP